MITSQSDTMLIHIQWVSQVQDSGPGDDVSSMMTAGGAPSRHHFNAVCHDPLSCNK